MTCDGQGLICRRGGGRHEETQSGGRKAGVVGGGGRSAYPFLGLVDLVLVAALEEPVADVVPVQRQRVQHLVALQVRSGDEEEETRVEGSGRRRRGGKCSGGWRRAYEGVGLGVLD